MIEHGSHLRHVVCPQPLLNRGQQLPLKRVAHSTRNDGCLTLSNTCSGIRHKPTEEDTVGPELRAEAASALACMARKGLQT